MGTRSGKNFPEFFFLKMQKGKAPTTCGSDVPTAVCHSSRITGSEPGQIFVHRNIANLVAEEDANLQAVLQYSVQALKVLNIVLSADTIDAAAYRLPSTDAPMRRSIIGCVRLRIWQMPTPQNLVDLEEAARIDRLSELNVLAQADRLAESELCAQLGKTGNHGKYTAGSTSSTRAKLKSCARHWRASLLSSADCTKAGL